MGATKGTFNEYNIIDDNESEFYIINKKQEKFVVRVDTEDLQRLIEYNRVWNASWRSGSKSYYIATCEYLGTVDGKVKYKTHYLHRWLFDYPKNVVIDHINHKTLDNRRSNLRMADQKKNLKHRNGKNKNNTSGYRNVCEINGMFVVQLIVNGKNKNVGKFKNINDAVEFSKIKREELYGEYKGCRYKPKNIQFKTQ